MAAVSTKDKVQGLLNESIGDLIGTFQQLMRIDFDIENKTHVGLVAQIFVTAYLEEVNKQAEEENSNEMREKAKEMEAFLTSNDMMNSWKEMFESALSI